MTTTINKFIIAISIASFVFGVFGYVTNTSVFVSQAHAQSTCGDCSYPVNPGGDNDHNNSTPVPKPTCDIKTNIAIVEAGENYVLTWKVQTGAPVNVYINGYHVEKNGSHSYAFKPSNLQEQYTLTATNAGGTCFDKVTVSKKVNTETPTCDVTANVSSVQANGEYTITWVGTPAGANFKLNGTAIAARGSHTFTFKPINTRETYVFTADNKGKTCSDTVVVTKVTPPEVPTCDVTANVSSVQANGEYTITWVGTPAGANFKLNGTAIAARGSHTFTFKPANTTETYTFTGDNNGKTCSDTVVVTKVNTPLPTCDTFNANSRTINRGQSSTLNWTTSNANSVTINNGVGSVAVDGSKSVSPNETTTYLLTAYGTNGRTDTCPVTVTVHTVNTLPTCDSFTASQMSLPYGGGNVTLTWNTSRANSVSISPLIGNVVNMDGSREVNVNDSTTFVLTARDANGDTDRCEAHVTVRPRDNNNSISCENNVNFYATDNSINNDQETKLVWNTNGVTHVSIDRGIGSQSDDGSVTVSPNDDTTYTLTASNGNRTINCPVHINVSGHNNNGSSNPRCDISISDRDISLGERVTLKWNTSYATDVTIKDSDGKVLVTTDDRQSNDKNDLYDGELTLRPEQDTTYTLRAEHGSDDVTCDVDVNVANSIVISQTRDQQPLVTGIALTHVPYTGFEAGPFLTLVFYGLLALWASYLAYVLVVRRNGGEATFATAGSMFAETTPAHSLFAPASTATPVFHPDVTAPITASTAAEAATIGYSVAEKDESTLAVEARAHAVQVLLSDDAVRAFMTATTNQSADRMTTLDAVLTNAKASYPTEDGWVVLGEERMSALVASQA